MKLITFIFTLFFFSTSVNATTNNTNYLFVQNSNKGSLTAIPNQSGNYTLVLSEIHPFITAFSDRPARKVHLITIKKFLTDWNNGADNFTKNPPNSDISLIHFENGKMKSYNFTLELLNKNYSTEKNTMTYTIHILGKEKIPSSLTFNYSSLFIDGCCCINC